MLVDDALELAAGDHELHIEMLENKGCFDCFLLTRQPFTPRGKLRPGAKSGLAAEGHFAWEPDADPLTGASPIDLRHLNEEQAGSGGFVRREGDRFVLGSGGPVRFWMVQGGGLLDMDQATLDRCAARLAKYGVNLVRLQLSHFFRARVAGDEAAFAAARDDLHRVVAALKRQGIYTYIGHLYWHTKDALPAGIVPGFEGGQAIELPFVSDEFRAFYRDYVDAILSPENPHTGLALKDDPAPAFVEINNESNQTLVAAQLGVPGPDGEDALGGPEVSSWGRDAPNIHSGGASCNRILIRLE